MDVTATPFGAGVPQLAGQPTPRRQRVLPVLRLVLAVLIAGAAVASVVSIAQLCVFEANLTGTVLGPLMRGGTYVPPDQPDVYYGLGTDEMFGLRISNGCSAALLVLPILVFATVMLLGHRGRVLDIMVGLTVAVAFIIAFNQARLGVIAWSSVHWGMEGFGWSHTIAGSLISLVGVAIATVTFFGTSIGLPRKAVRAVKARTNRLHERSA
ncbi:hypothetical protein [Streptomyces melanogenes]|uniref:hypothetical protein n=1 Tax=Streptomyces melanogenes TaxID=67326 RepID=UPI00167CAD92|nr:hypothetical protein [Streptomyces melanogenes]GGP92602.1 hypothetical protein GCM10010278_83370 [Streptomyces melanogenes]